MIDSRAALEMFVRDVLAEQDPDESIPFVTWHLADAHVVGMTRFMSIAPRTIASRSARRTSRCPTSAPP